MNLKPLLLLLAIAFVFVPQAARSDLADELGDLVGYVIVDAKTIVAWADDDESDEGSFNGCSYGRRIKFDDNTVLTCAGYGYMYAYRPTAVLLAKEISLGGRKLVDIKMVVEDEIFDMR